MKNQGKDLMEWLDATPPTKQLVRDLENIDIPDLAKDPEFQADLLKGAVTECVIRAMAEQGVNRNQLAKLMGKSRQYVGQSLNETANFTLERLAEFAVALEREISIVFHRKEEVVRICRTESQWNLIRGWQSSAVPAETAAAILGSRSLIDKQPDSYCPADTSALNGEEQKDAELKFAA